MVLQNILSAQEIEQLLAQGSRNFANKTFASRTLANGEIPAMRWRKFTVLSPIGETPRVRWQKYSGLSPVSTAHC